MKQLSETWFAEGYIDFELKKYTLLAYLQEVNKYFDQNKLYPQLSDIIFHFNNIISFRENKKYLQEHFPKKITGLQLEKLQTLYEQMIQDDELMVELEDIITYSAGKIKTSIKTGAEIYEFVEDKIQIDPVGLIPINTKEGYFFLRTANSKTIYTYEYQLSIFEKKDEKYRTIKTSLINNFRYKITSTYEALKYNLISHRTHLPNPAVFVIESKLQFPIEETLLPIAKRCLVKYIST